MTQTSVNYARVLYDLAIGREVVQETIRLFRTVPEIQKVLNSPVAARTQKYLVIDRIFPESMHHFLKVLCDNGDADSMEEITDAYHTYECRMLGIVRAELFYVTAPEEVLLTQIREMVRIRYGGKAVELGLTEDSSLMGGFILRVGDMETDCSLKARLKRLQQNLKRR